MDKDFPSCLDEGLAAEESFLDAMIEMGYTPLVTTAEADPVGKLDAMVMQIDGAEPNRRVFLRVVDVKTAGKIPPREVLEEGALVVKWRTASTREATSFSNESTSVTHLAYVLPANDYWKRPFYLVSIDHFRAFFIEHNTEEDASCLRPLKNPTVKHHNALIVMRQFLREYCLSYFSYDGEHWHEEVIGNTREGLEPVHLLANEEDLQCFWLEKLVSDVNAWRSTLLRKYAEGIKPGDLLHVCKLSENQALVEEIKANIPTEYRTKVPDKFIPYWEK